MREINQVDAPAKMIDRVLIDGLDNRITLYKEKGDTYLLFGHSSFKLEQWQVDLLIKEAK